jgi:hypothetical protein
MVWTGMAEFKQQLRNLPAELVGEASRIVEGAGNAAAFDIKSGYGVHRHTGNLQDHVTVEHKTGGFIASAIVKSTARHAHIFEFGSQARYTKSGSFRGRMPPGNIFIPRMIKWRRRMFEELKAMLQRHGLLVTGEANARAA